MRRELENKVAAAGGHLRKWILPKWEREYLHDIKPVAVEQWLRSLREISNGSKSKIRNIMSGIFSHAIRYELADRMAELIMQTGKVGHA